MQVVLKLLRTGPYLRGWLQDQTPKMLTSKAFTTFSISLQLQYRYCYFIKQTLNIFFSRKAFCSNTQKVLKGVCRRGWGATTLPRPLLDWGGDTPPQCLPLLDAFGVSNQYQRLRCLISVNPSEVFLHTALGAQLYFWRSTVDTL